MLRERCYCLELREDRPHWYHGSDPLCRVCQACRSHDHCDEEGHCLDAYGRCACHTCETCGNHVVEGVEFCSEACKAEEALRLAKAVG